MKYPITTTSLLKKEATIAFLGSLSACLLKIVERFSGFLHFEYDRADLQVSATCLGCPPRMDDIKYDLTIFRNYV